MSRLLSGAKWGKVRLMQIPLAEPEVRKLSVSEYYRMAEAGIIKPSERVELLNGQVIQMAPIGPRHATIVDKLIEIFVEKRKGRYRVRSGGPIRIPDYNEPQPDIVLYKTKLKEKHPEPADIYLVVEVSDTTLAIDSGDKLRAYEQGGIKEYWIVDISKKAVRIYTLKAGSYGLGTKKQGTVSPHGFSDVTVDIGRLF